MRGVDPDYQAHVRRLYGSSGKGEYEWDRLFGAGEAVQSMTLQPGWSVLMDLLAQERADILERLEGPKPLGAEATQHALGQLRGIKAAESAAHALSEVYRVELETQRTKHEAATELVAGR